MERMEYEQNFEDQSGLRHRILESMENSSYDFRTVGSLAKELEADEEVVQHELDGLGSIVRRPVGQELYYPDWYRLTSRGMTRQERWARWKALITFQSMDDDY